MYWLDYKFIIMLCVIIGICSTVNAVEKKKSLHCFQCNNTNTIDCDFLDYIVSNYVFLKPCDENVTECQVTRFNTPGYPKIVRTCKLNEGCPKEAKCCTCRKKGCNGNNMCTFSRAFTWKTTTLYTFIPTIIFYVMNN